jgi:hypothetical protein
LRLPPYEGRRANAETLALFLPNLALVRPGA